MRLFAVNLVTTVSTSLMGIPKSSRTLAPCVAASDNIKPRSCTSAQIIAVVDIPSLVFVIKSEDYCSYLLLRYREESFGRCLNTWPFVT
jgi:hypothetical protein